MRDCGSIIEYVKLFNCPSRPEVTDLFEPERYFMGTKGNKVAAHPFNNTPSQGVSYILLLMILIYVKATTMLVSSQ